MKHFEISEFDSPDRPGYGAMDRGFLNMLDQAREIAGVPFVINSGFRTPEHNRAVGGSPTSSHLTGHAADIMCKSGGRRLLIVRALFQAGFKRIGIAKTFIHVDNDPGKTPSIWLY